MPPRDLVVVFFADEEAGGTKGSHFMVAEHPEVFDGVTEAISEVGGYSVTSATAGDGGLQTAEKGIAWLRLTGGPATLGAEAARDAIVRLAEAISPDRPAHKWPREFIPSVRTLCSNRLSEITSGHDLTRSRVSGAGFQCAGRCGTPAT